jgi:hypothetical protein
MIRDSARGIILTPTERPRICQNRLSLTRAGEVGWAGSEVITAGGNHYLRRKEIQFPRVRQFQCARLNAYGSDGRLRGYFESLIGSDNS